MGPPNIPFRTCSQKAEQILGVTAATLGDHSENNPDEMNRIFTAAIFKQFHFKFRGRIEVYQVSRNITPERLRNFVEAFVALDFSWKTQDAFSCPRIHRTLTR